MFESIDQDYIIDDEEETNELDITGIEDELKEFGL
jgi:hypothetical protein